MSTQDTIANLRAKAIAQFTADLDVLLAELTANLEQDIAATHLEAVTKTVLGKRKKYAETDEVMAERGMTLDEIKLHNAYSDGYNARGRQLRKRLLGTEVEPTEAEPEVEPTPAPVVIEAVAEVVTEPVVEEAPTEPV